MTHKEMSLFLLLTARSALVKGDEPRKKQARNGDSSIVRLRRGTCQYRNRKAVYGRAKFLAPCPLNPWANPPKGQSKQPVVRSHASLLLKRTCACFVIGTLNFTATDVLMFTSALHAFA